MATFGSRLKAALAAHGITERYSSNLAKIAGIEIQTARKWLKMREADVSAKRLVKVCSVLGVRAHWLVMGEGHPTSVRTLHSLDQKLLHIAMCLPREKLLELIKHGESLTSIAGNE